MGLPAIKYESERTARPRLRLVPPKKARKGRSRSTSSANAAVALGICRAFVIIAVVVSVLGMGRVWVTVQAAEASRDAGALRDRIRTERYKGDMLEIRQSALGSPSRIRAIAGETMGMAPASGVTYLELPEQKTSTETKNGRGSSDGIKKVLADMMDLAAGEAEVMLVGDVGLASAQ